jgi:transposase-like protein
MRRIIALKKTSTGESGEKRVYRPRRVWTLEQKLDILAYAETTSTLTAAREYDVDVRLIFQWRLHLRNGELERRTWNTPGRDKRWRGDATLPQAKVKADEDA